MASFGTKVKAARACAWELIPSTLVMGGLWYIIYWAKPAGEKWLFGRTTPYGDYEFWSIMLQNRERRHTEMRFKLAVERKKEEIERNKLKLT